MLLLFCSTNSNALNLKHKVISEMSAIHHDTSCDLKVVGAKLKDILEVWHQATEKKHEVAKMLV